MLLHSGSSTLTVLHMLVTGSIKYTSSWICHLVFVLSAVIIFIKKIFTLKSFWDICIFSEKDIRLGLCPLPNHC
jgi:hypothetical protein